MLIYRRNVEFNREKGFYATQKYGNTGFAHLDAYISLQWLSDLDVARPSVKKLLRIIVRNKTSFLRIIVRNKTKIEPRQKRYGSC